MLSPITLYVTAAFFSRWLSRCCGISGTTIFWIGVWMSHSLLFDSSQHLPLFFITVLFWSRLQFLASCRHVFSYDLRYNHFSALICTPRLLHNAHIGKSAPPLLYFYCSFLLLGHLSSRLPSLYFILFEGCSFRFPCSINFQAYISITFYL